MRLYSMVPLAVAAMLRPAPGASLEFVVIGDTRPRIESESFRPFEGLITQINAAHPALVINLGDLIYGYGPASKEKQWDKYEAVSKTIQAPYYQLPGNHDTHSKAARRIYGHRFGKFYQSFDHADCHFVLLDNTEEERWGYLGPAQLDWLRRDLSSTRARSVFVFLHFPVWEPAGLAPEVYECWAQTLHPLFKQSRVRAVFGGHYHTYGPTREFDGIRYFITGGGGAELRPEYRKAGGEYHFVKVRVTGDVFDVRVVTGHGELSDPEADLMAGLQFASRHVSRIGIKADPGDLKAGVNFSASVENPYPDGMNGRAAWLLDASRFRVEPSEVRVQIPAGATRTFSFELQALQATADLASLPRLEFNVVSAGRRHRFHREVRLLQAVRTPYRASAPVLDGDVSDWAGVPALALGAGTAATLRSAYDAQNLYLAVTVPSFDPAEAQEQGFSDALQIGIARRLRSSDFGRDLFRVGLDSQTQELRDRTAGHRLAVAVPGARAATRTGDGRATHEISIPLRLLKGLHAGAGKSMVIDLSFPVPEMAGEGPTSAEPDPNTFAYRVRYGHDSLVPVYFVELSLLPPP